MSPSIKHLRRGVVTGGITLLLVLAAFLAVARFKGHYFGLDLPGRLGVNISETASGYTYSQSQKGHTLFTIHASKLVQYKGDQAELHDVTITLYGPEGSGRSDKIYGSDFTYDRKRGIAHAAGAVRIDFASPEKKADPGAGAGSLTAGGRESARAPAQPDPARPHPAQPDPAQPDPAQPDPAQPDKDSTIHVTTSGVVFNQATGEATTDQRVDFALTRATGSATGADYNAKNGVLVLDRQVTLTTTAVNGSGADTTIHAEHAQLLRDTHQAYLIQADALSQGRHTTSDQATITFRPDGSAEHVEARGHVRLATEDGAEVHASAAIIELDALSHPVVANLSGGITYHSETGDQTMQGSAVSGTLDFVAAAKPAPGNATARPGGEQALHHAQFRDAVTFVLQQRSLEGDRNGSSTREMRASKLDIDFAPGAEGKAEAQHVLGSGGAMANLHDVPAKGPAKVTSVSAEQLLATLTDGREFKVLDGKGNTKVVDTSADGGTSTSTGDTLHATLAPGHRGSGAAGIESAMQTGDVTIVQAPAPDAKNADGSLRAPLHATAQQAQYQAADQVLQLTGDPHLRTDTLALSADRVDYHRDSGDATAVGNVKSTYEPQAGQKAPTLGGEGPVHVTADHAQLTRATDISIFYGKTASPARMWQGGDSVTAPVLELSRDQQTLDAHGEHGDYDALVHAVFAARAEPQKAPPASSPPEKLAAQKPEINQTQTSQAPPGLAGSAPTRLSSVTLHYSDKDRRADLLGSVTAEQPSGVVHADQAQVYLTPNAPGKPSQLDRMVATGHVVITQPGRRGRGDKLVYTAADSRYVLTGSPAQPPRIFDSEKGTTTGAALIFKSADDSVEVSSQTETPPGTAPGGASAASHARTVTDTRSPR